MPAYNHRRYVEEALRSAIDQDYPNLRVVACDDGSKDGTDEIIREYARRYPDRVTALVDHPHLGLTKNSNRALRACTGTYIAMHSGDDVFLPGKVSAQVHWLEQEERRVLCGHDIEVFESDTGRVLSVERPIARDGHGPQLFAREGAFIYGQAIMVRRSALPAGGFDERIPVSSDVKLWVDCLARGGTFGCIDGVYARYRMHAGGVTHDGVTHLLDHLRSLDLIEGEYPFLAADCAYRRARLEQAIGEWHLSHLHFPEARAYLTTALRRRTRLPATAVLALAAACLPVALFRGARRMKRAFASTPGTLPSTR
jgi:glycosyltransferase involved in cell wall biosynthesis